MWSCTTSSASRYVKLGVFLAVVVLLLVTFHLADPSNSAFDSFRTRISLEDSSAATPTTSAVVDPDVSEYAAICLSVKGQKLDLSEWFVHHYHHAGVRRFYVMDDGTVPPLSETPDWGIPSEAITFVYYTSETRRSWYQQLNAYNDCQRNYGHLHTWIAYIDADEYIEMTGGKESFVGFLKSFEANETVGAVGVSWQMHTSNGLLKRPASARKAFTTCITDDPEQDNRHIKAIVKTKYFVNAENAHTMQIKPGTITVGEHHDTVPWAFRTPITRDRISLHHYAVNSREQYDEKMSRGNGMGDPKDMTFWNHVESLPSYKCDSMAKLNP